MKYSAGFRSSVVRKPLLVRRGNAPRQSNIDLCSDIDLSSEIWALHVGIVFFMDPSDLFDPMSFGPNQESLQSVRVP